MDTRRATCTYNVRVVKKEMSINVKSRDNSLTFLYEEFKRDLYKKILYICIRTLYKHDAKKILHIISNQH